ncbi:hypothetical protein BGZ73_002102 [Actinomortierella ambigua]|nr:hypothetical protein BGZ73_002102 [Actinomortierella ambigua]
MSMTMPQDSVTRKIPVTLPLDILELIVDNLFWCLRHVSTICALLTTSKAMFPLAAKRLYENPWDTAYNTKNRSQTILRFTAFVLSLAPPTDQEFAYYLQALHLADPDTIRCSTGSLSGTNYFSFIRKDHFISSYDVFSLLSTTATKALNTAFASVCRDGSLLHPSTRYKVSLILRMECATYKTIIHGASGKTSPERDGKNDRLSELRHIVIPIWEQSQFMDKIAHLTQLESVEVYHPGERILMGHPGGDEEGGHAEQDDHEFGREWLAVAAEETVQAAISFVRLFNATHGFGQLRHAAVVVPGGWEYCQSGRVDSTLQRYRELYSLLPAIDPPKALTYTTWIPYCLSPYRDRISLNQVTTIGFPPKLDVLNAWATPQDQLLQQCPALRELKIAPLDSNLFRWAVERKEEYVAAHGQPRLTRDSISNWTALGASRRRHSTHLADLQALALTCQPSSAEQVTNDAMYAFGRTLKKFDLLIEEKGQPTVLHLGEGANGNASGTGNSEGRQRSGWDLPRLQYFNVHSQGGSVRLAPDALASCPMLEEVSCDEEFPIEYVFLGYQNLRLWQPWTSPMMKRLALLKSFALCFNPESLASMNGLTFLTLQGPTGLGRRYFVVRTTTGSLYLARDTIDHAASPSSGPLPLPDASLWTWRWNLSQLQELVLVGEPAFRFELNMLRQCPSLERLQLKLGVHGRKLEFDAEEAAYWEENSDPSASPPLKSLILEGAWMLSAKTIRLLMTKALRTGLIYFHFGTHVLYTEACTIDEWIEYTRQHPDLQGMVMNVDDIDQEHLSNEKQLAMADRHGLEKINGAPRGIGISSVFHWRNLLRGRWVDPSIQHRLWIINGTPYTLKGSLKRAE